MNPTKHTHLSTELLWLSDLHLERVSDQEKERFLERLKRAHYDAALITGDISTSTHLTRHLREISEACGDRKVAWRYDPLAMLKGNGLPGGNQIVSASPIATHAQRQVGHGAVHLVLLDPSGARLRELQRDRREFHLC